MSLLDNLATAVMGKTMVGSQGSMVQIGMEMFNQYGGLNGILDKFKQAGLGDLATSWVGKGQNLPVTAEQISSVLGNSLIAEMAAKFGMTSEELTSKIAQNLPSIINKMTPNGEVPADSSNLLSMVMKMLK
ncbi:MAG: YidB family protein [Methylotenera sp.]|uniref:YidB family protein n=1 Tax=Methylotenera sp. TaxID=2051956 RepID=UPI0024876BDD|nr:YidB family protein [Methylotenera sp.]MDI1308895.1 YidB family protein [Methylotenera sp.]